MGNRYSGRERPYEQSEILALSSFQVIHSPLLKKIRVTLRFQYCSVLQNVCYLGLAMIRTTRETTSNVYVRERQRKKLVVLEKKLQNQNVTHFIHISSMSLLQQFNSRKFILCSLDSLLLVLPDFTEEIGNGERLRLLQYISVLE